MLKKILGYILCGVGKFFSPVGFLLFFNRYTQVAQAIIRGGFYSLYFGKAGKNIKIGKNVLFVGNLKKISLGSFNTIDNGVSLEIIEDIIIGNNIHICPNVYIQSGERVILEDYSCLSNGVKVYASSNDFDETYGVPGKHFISMSSNAPFENQLFRRGKVHIKRNAFVGMNTVIMPGVTIGVNSIVGAQSFVNKDIPDNVIAFGNPAQIYKRL